MGAIGYVSSDLVTSWNGEVGAVTATAADVDAVPESLPDAKGDLFVATAADVPARLAVGADGLHLTADPAASTGLAWRSADPYRLAAGATTLPRWIMGGNTGVSVGSSGTLRLMYFQAPRAELISQLAIVTGTTAAGATPTLCKMGVWIVAANGDLTLVGATANDTTLFAGASTRNLRSILASYTSVAGQYYACAPLVVTAAAMPTFAGISLNAATAQAFSSAPRLTGQVTGQTDLPAFISAASIVASNAGIGMEIIP